MTNEQRAAVATAYANMTDVDAICSTFNLTRTELATIIRETGIRRGQSEETTQHIVRLYASLKAAEAEISMHVRQIEHLTMLLERHGLEGSVTPNG